MEPVYKSHFGDKEINTAKYLAEIAVLRMAKAKGVKLTLQLLKSPYWAKNYKNAIISAHSLLKVYRPDAIVNVFKNFWSWSLRIKELHLAIKLEQEKLETKQEIIEASPEIVPSDTTSFRKNEQGKKSKLSKL